MLKIPEHGQPNRIYSHFRLRNPLVIYLHICYTTHMNYINTITTRLRKIFGGRTPTVFSTEEQLGSNRIMKSATPKYDLSWYVKWVASVFILLAMSMRGIVDYVYYDMLFSLVGLILWLWVSFMWKDRALIVLNAVGFIFVLRNFIQYLAGV